MRVYSIALGSGADQALLQSIASQTNGAFFFTGWKQFGQDRKCSDAIMREAPVCRQHKLLYTLQCQMLEYYSVDFVLKDQIQTPYLQQQV